MEENKNGHNPELLEKILNKVDFDIKNKDKNKKLFTKIYGISLNILYIIYFIFGIYSSYIILKFIYYGGTPPIRLILLSWLNDSIFILIIYLFVLILYILFYIKKKYITASLIITIPLLLFFYGLLINSNEQVNNDQQIIEKPVRTLIF